MELIIGNEYNFKNQPERLKYTGKSGVWNQFELIGKQGTWCEVLDEDLYMIEPCSDTDNRKAQK